MTTPEAPRRTRPSDPTAPVVAGPTETAAPAEPAQSQEPSPPITPGTPTPRPRAEQVKEQGRRAGQKASALLNDAAALANKVRREAPKRIREAREKRVAGRCVILTEVDGRQLAIGPYPDDQAAHQDTTRVSGTPHVIELFSQAAYFGPEDGNAPSRP